MNKYQKVEILWYDTIRTDTWGDKPSVEENEMRCHTLGYFYEENEHSITVVSTYGKDEELQSIQIPKGCIIKINELRTS